MRSGIKVLLCLLLATVCVVCVACGAGPVTQPTAAPSEGMDCPPWETGGKVPEEYAWDEFLALSELNQEAFFLWFQTPEDFEVWMNRVQPQEHSAPTQPTEAVTVPWEAEGKKPDAYTWEEFLALTEEQQETFFLWFETPEKFEAWMEAAQAVAGYE